MMCDEKINHYVANAYVLRIEKKLPLDVIEFDKIKVTEMKAYQENHDDPEELENLCVKGNISYIFGNIILFYIPRDRSRRRNSLQIDTNRLHQVDFEPNRVTFRVIQRTLETAICGGLHRFLSNFEETNAPPNNDDFYDFEWINPVIQGNEEQQLAIENIVNRASFPSPFIIFGGPGKLYVF
jgi:hypothetical protein